MLPYCSLGDSAAPVWFSIVVGLDSMFSAHIGKNLLYCGVYLPLDCVARLTQSKKQHAYYTHTHATKVCEHTRHCATAALNLPTSQLSALLRGIKQTVIDLRYDCLFCLAVSDG